ncbi:MAG: right-handed parallel beta-helix repeat-containing protein [Pyrinomonadaceae bacterium MAG19_C2-C3]|nr:right-handed parallel beta-helix repeat-containing protein [Pyrinomonadaceae bacterium MAG19_C2-C3]
MLICLSWWLAASGYWNHLLLLLGHESKPVVKAEIGYFQSPMPITDKQFYVSPQGTPDGDGSAARPWNLATALAQPPAARPGAVIWLRGGVYKGVFLSRLTGTEGAPITVRAVNGERAILDSGGQTGEVLTIRGAWTNYWGFEVMNSDPRRVTDVSGSRAVKEWRRDGINLIGAHTKLINLVIHDTAVGIGAWSAAQGAEIYGCIIYNNGWLGPDRGHGHGIYAQNETGTKRIVDNIAFNNFGRGMEAYGTGAATIGFHFEGNVCFNNYSPAARATAKRHPNLFVGTIRHPADRITILSNYLYHPPGTYPDFGGNLALGFKALNNKSIVVKDNYVAGGNRALYMNEWEAAIVTGNTLYISSSDATPVSRLAEVHQPAQISSPQISYQWDENTYFDNAKQTQNIAPASFFFNKGTKRPFDEWKSASGFDRRSRYQLGRPKGTQIFLRQNKYEPERTHITVYNWDLKDKLEVDVSQVLPRGATFELRNVQDLFGAPVLTGTYNGGALTLPMINLKVAAPVGYDFTPVSTAPEFAAFVLIRTKTARE